MQVPAGVGGSGSQGLGLTSLPPPSQSLMLANMDLLLSIDSRPPANGIFINFFGEKSTAVLCKLLLTVNWPFKPLVGHSSE